MNQDITDPQISTREQAEELCSTMQETLVRLIDLLQTEISLVKNKQTTDINSLVSEKNTLTNSFMKLFTRLKNNAAIIGRHSPKQVAQIRRMIAQFKTVMQANLTALSAAKSVNETMIDTIVDISSKKQKGPTAYGNNACLNKADTRKAAPIAVNKVL